MCFGVVIHTNVNNAESGFRQGGGGQGADGKTSTAGFVSGLYKSIPPLSELFDQAGMSLPEYLGKKNAENTEDAEATED